MYATVWVDVGKCEGEGALRWWRRCSDGSGLVRSGRGVGMVERGGRYATAEAEVWLRVGVGVLGWWRKCVGVDTYVC